MADDTNQPRSRVVGTLVWLAIVLPLVIGFWQTLMQVPRLKRDFDMMGMILPAPTKLLYSLMSMVTPGVFDVLIPASYMLVTLVIVFSRHVVNRRRFGVLLPQILTIWMTISICVTLCFILLANNKMAEAMARR